MITRIDLPTDVDNQNIPACALTVALDDANYTLSFRWSSRAACWMFDVAEGDGTLIAAGLVVRAEVPIILPAAYTNAPPGFFFAHDRTGKKQDPGQFDFGTRVSFGYVSVDQRTELGV